jgi:hypothetical protein
MNPATASPSPGAAARLATAPIFSRVRRLTTSPIAQEFDRLRLENALLRMLARSLYNQRGDEEDAGYWEARATELEQKLADQNARIAELWATMARIVP